VDEERRRSWSRKECPTRDGRVFRAGGRFRGTPPLRVGPRGPEFFCAGAGGESPENTPRRRTVTHALRVDVPGGGRGVRVRISLRLRLHPRRRLARLAPPSRAAARAR